MLTALLAAHSSLSCLYYTLRDHLVNELDNLMSISSKEMPHRLVHRPIRQRQFTSQLTFLFPDDSSHAKMKNNKLTSTQLHLLLETPGQNSLLSSVSY